MKSYNESDSENYMRVIVRVIVKIIVMVIIRVKIMYINVLVRLVSRRGGSLNWT